jgi:methionyl-tRNA synthetase
MAERIHITTAIFYSNGTPHVGSAYEALAADVFARSQRRRYGRGNVSFLSGTDEHGDKRFAILIEHGQESSGTFQYLQDSLNTCGNFQKA